jgi:hypothetical protein
LGEATSVYKLGEENIITDTIHVEISGYSHGFPRGSGSINLYKWWMLMEFPVATRLPLVPWLQFP